MSKMAPKGSGKAFIGSTGALIALGALGIGINASLFTGLFLFLFLLFYGDS